MIITYMNILAQITNVLQTNFPNIEVTESSVREGFKRPAFLINIDNTNRISHKYYVERSMSIAIYYYPSNQYTYTLEVADIQQRLEQFFDNYLHVQDRYIQIANTSSQIVDTVFSFDMDITYYEEPYGEDDNLPLIEGIVYRGE